MRAAHMVLILAALAGAAAGLIVKKNIFVDKALNWFEAQTYCRNHYVDLTTVDSQEELDRFKEDTAGNASVRFWIGLSKRLEAKVYSQWSDGTTLGFTDWATGDPSDSSQSCVTFQAGHWTDFYCTNPLPFVCYKWNVELIVSREMKTWKEALDHCRLNYIDLISINTDTDQIMIKKQIVNIQTPRFWTGMRFLDGSWFWVNKKPLMNTPLSLPSCPAKPYQCGARRSDADVWENRDCEEKMNFICYR